MKKIFACITALLLMGSAVFLLGSAGCVKEGVTVSGVAVGGMPYPAAAAAVREKLSSARVPFTLHTPFGDTMPAVSYTDNVWELLKKAKKNGVYEATLQREWVEAEREIAALCERAYTPPKDAALTFTRFGFSYTAEAEGVACDYVRSLAAALHALRAGERIDKIYLQKGETDDWIPNDKEAVEMDLQQMPVLFGGYGSVPVAPSCHIFPLKGNRYALSYQEDPCLWNYGDGIFLKERFNDTIYTASKGVLAPRYVFGLGDWHCPYDKRLDVDGSFGRISIDYVLEGRRCLYFVFQTNYYNMRDKETFFGIYDKETGSVKISDSDEIVSEDGRPVVRQLQTATSDGKLLGLIPASEHDPSRAEDDNPVAVILY